MNKRNKVLIFSIIFMNMATIGGCSLIQKPKDEVEKVLLTTSVLNLPTEKAEKASITPEFTSKGKVCSTESYSIYGNINGGILDTLNFNAFNSVKKGEVIAEFSSKDIENEIRLQEILVEYNKAQLEKTKEEKSGDYSIKAAELNLEYESEKLRILKEKKEGLIVRSPIDGVITEIINAKRGAYLSPSDLIVVIQNGQDLILSCEINDKFLDICYEGMKVEIEYKRKNYIGEVVEIVPQDDPSLKKERGIYIKFSGEIPENLELGAGVTYKLFGETKEDVLVVPTIAIKSDGKTSWVYVLEDGLKKKRLVEIGISDEKKTEIKSGLEADEKIVLE